MVGSPAGVLHGPQKLPIDADMAAPGPTKHLLALKQTFPSKVWLAAPRGLFGATPIILQHSPRRYWPLGPMCLGDKRTVCVGVSAASPAGRGPMNGHVVRPIPHPLEIKTHAFLMTGETDPLEGGKSGGEGGIRTPVTLLG
jgi:hypothetical protein